MREYESLLKRKLDYHYKVFDRSQLSPDPLEFLHLFSDEKDVEVMGIIASVFAYGNVRQIITVLDKLVYAMGDRPYYFIQNINKKIYQNKIIGIKHRFYTTDDIINFFLILHSIYKEYENLKTFYLRSYKEDDPTVKKSLIKFSENLIGEINKVVGRKNISPGIRFMFPSPDTGSACKRMNLFLRWMVRKDELDFGLWKEISTNQLIIPVDTHVARICRHLNLTVRKNVSWLMAEEITNNLREFDSADPVKYDFAICHIGMRKLNF